MGVIVILLHPPPPQEDTLGFCILETLQVHDEQDYPRDITHLHIPQPQRRRGICKIDTSTIDLGLQPKEVNDMYLFNKLHRVPLHFKCK